MRSIVKEWRSASSSTMSAAVGFALVLVTILLPKHSVVQEEQIIYASKDKFSSSATKTQEELFSKGYSAFSPIEMRMRFRIQISSLPSDSISVISTNSSSNQGASVVIDGAGFLNLNLFSSAFPSGQVQQIRVVNEIQPNEPYFVQIDLDRRNAGLRVEVENSSGEAQVVYGGPLSDPYHVDLSPESVLIGSEGFAFVGGTISEFSAEFKYSEIVASLNSLRALLALFSLIIGSQAAYRFILSWKKLSESQKQIV